MKHISEYITESLVSEGGLAGHMAHIIDCNEYTCKDLKNLITDLFAGKITDITEKTDGMQIMATLDKDGSARFLRNTSDLAGGGMDLENMANKWAGKPATRDAYVSAGKTISEIMHKLPVKFFNPDRFTKLCLNCEVINPNTVNVIPYGRAAVDIHNIAVFTMDISGKWSKTHVTETGMDKVSDACRGVEKAWVSPRLIIKVTEDSQKLVKKYMDELDDLFLGDDDLTIGKWKRGAFNQIIDNNEEYSWINTSREGKNILYERWFNNVKSANLRLLKTMYYPGYSEKLDDIDKSKKWANIVRDAVFPLDSLFLKIGNDIIKICNGMLNDNMSETAVREIKKRLELAVKAIRANGIVNDQIKLAYELRRLEALGDNPINAAEGIVLKYNNRYFKLTGSFAPLNQIFGMTYNKK